MSQPRSSKFEAIVWTSAIITLVLPSLLGAPLSSTSDFYHNVLYQNSSKCPQLPKIKESDDAYLSVKINLVCNASQPTENRSRVCQSLQGLFHKLCQLSSDASVVKSNTLVDLLKVNKLGLQNFCKRLSEVYHNISHFNAKSEKWSSPFEGSDKTDEESCESVCSNSPVPNITGDEDFQVGPQCILLFEGYNIYQPSMSLVPAPPSNKITPAEPGMLSSEPKPINQNHSQLDNKAEAAASQEQKPEESTQSPSLTLSGHDREGVGQVEEVKPKSKAPLEKQENKTSTNAGSINSQNDSSVTSIPNPGKRTDSALSPNVGNGQAQPENHQDVKIGSGSSSIKEQQQIAQGLAVSSSSSTTSTTTVASIDGNGPDGLPPPQANSDKKITSSTAVPSGNGIKKPDSAVNDNPGKVAESSDNRPTNVELPLPLPVDGKKKAINKGTKLNDVDDASANLPEDDYNSPGGEELDPVGSPAKSDVDQGIDFPSPVGVKNEGFGGGSSYNKASKNQDDNFLGSNDGFPGDMPFGNRGTTINVSLNETDVDTGFFNYFLFCATLVGLLYLIFHNKKKLIAYVVEGRRPRGRGRRASSTSSQYRMLENNFD